MLKDEKRQNPSIREAAIHSRIAYLLRDYDPEYCGWDGGCPIAEIIAIAARRAVDCNKKVRMRGFPPYDFISRNRRKRGIDMFPVLEQISKIGIVPVVKIDNAKDALPLAKALCAGGLPCAEVTFRTDAAEEAIKIMADNFPEMCVGAGTVLNAEQVDKAVAAGAKFIVSPGLNPNTVKYCVEKNIPITPGTSSPSDIEQAIELGLEVVKFFPAEQSGGLAKIKAMAAPYVNMKFMPTGGINAKNLISYLDFPKIIACGGSWMVPGDLINAGEWDKIEQLTREAVQTMLGFELAHVGVNAENPEEAEKIAKRLGFILGMPVKIGNSSIFTGSIVEVMKTPYLGKNGHLGIRTNYVERAMNYLSTVLGVEFDESTAKKDEKGVKAIYMKEEIGGFAVHLVRK